MRRREVFLILSLVIALPLCIGLYAQREIGKGKIIDMEKLLMSYAREKDRREAELNEKIQDREKQIGYLLVLLKKERIIKTKLISNIERKSKGFSLALQQTKGVELERIVLKSVQDIKGKVLAVDVQNGVVVVNLGMDHDAKVGDRFSVYRGDDFIGRLELMMVQKQLSAAAVISEEKGIKIAVNDLVRIF